MFLLHKTYLKADNFMRVLGTYRHISVNCEILLSSICHQTNLFKLYHLKLVAINTDRLLIRLKLVTKFLKKQNKKNPHIDNKRTFTHTQKNRIALIIAPTIEVVQH